MLVQHHHPIPIPLSRRSPPPSEYDYNASASPPPVEKINTNNSTKSEPDPGQDKTNLPFTIRRARIEDATAIAELGATVFSTTFGFSIPPKDLNAFLSEAYTPEAIQEDILCSRKHIFVACLKPSALDLSDSSDISIASMSEDDSNDGHSEEEIIGFAQLTEDTVEPCLSHLDGAVELQRLYVTTSHHGRGAGQRLAREVEAVACSLGYTSLWLGVWEGNFKAQEIYERLGFAKVGDHEFKIGKCIQMDWIMSKDL